MLSSTGWLWSICFFLGKSLLFAVPRFFNVHFVFIWFPWRLRFIQNKLWTKVMKSWLLCDVTRYTILAISSFSENTAFVSCEMEMSHYSCNFLKIKLHLIWYIFHPILVSIENKPEIHQFSKMIKVTSDGAKLRILTLKSLIIYGRGSGNPFCKVKEKRASPFSNIEMKKSCLKSWNVITWHRFLVEFNDWRKKKFDVKKCNGFA